jgi:hypothetical protein
LQRRRIDFPIILKTVAPSGATVFSFSQGICLGRISSRSDLIHASGFHPPWRISFSSPFLQKKFQLFSKTPKLFAKKCVYIGEGL